MAHDNGLIKGSDGRVRCFWPGELPDPSAYHDEEWGRPVTNDNRLFEKICLEGFQSGLSWLTILRKRENFRAAFAGFDFRKVARFDEADVERLLADKGIGRVLLEANGDMETELLFAGIVLLSITGVILFLIIEGLERVMIRWHVSQRIRE